MSSSPVTTRTSPLGRGTKVRSAVLAAALAELAETGYTNLTLDNVARRAGVHKTTVYRRWKDRESLVTDAVIDQVASGVPLIDTQDLDTDLRAYARDLVRWLDSATGRALVAILMSDAARIPQIANLKTGSNTPSHGSAPQSPAASSHLTPTPSN